MNENDDLMIFADDEDKEQVLEFTDTDNSQLKEPGKSCNRPWRLLIVDDDKEIHVLTKMVLADYSFENRAIEMLSAYSAKEAIEILKKEKDIALVLLDVVMETGDAGLNCVKAIREELKNQDIRIILRTGQPGQAPEQEVIVGYDINDYKAKTELTAQKLFTVVTASFRAYKHIKVINQSRKGLENIISASRSLFEIQSFSLFATGILRQLTSILELDESSLYANCSSISAFRDNQDQEFKVLAATGVFAGKENCNIEEVIPNNVFDKLKNAISKNQSIFTDNTYTGYFETKKGERHLLYFQWQRPLTAFDRELISIFSTNVAVAFENISMTNDVILNQKEVIFTLSEIVEGGAEETFGHLRRVTAVSCLLAEKLGLTNREIDLIRFSTPMHDIGKMEVPNEILSKPAKLTPEEFEIVKKHSTVGYNFFKGSGREMMKAAAIIAYQHHERWDGKGYPKGLKGKDIHIFGRIVCLADVVDALAHKRPYKDAWSMNQVIEELKKERGQQFEPKLVDLFLDSLDEYEKIRKKYPDVD
jgi:response regulator RpfG family c-di-GMP phosphodiesterase